MMHKSVCWSVRLGGIEGSPDGAGEVPPARGCGKVGRVAYGGAASTLRRRKRIGGTLAEKEGSLRAQRGQRGGGGVQYQKIVETVPEVCDASSCKGGRRLVNLTCFRPGMSREQFRNQSDGRPVEVIVRRCVCWICRRCRREQNNR